MSTLETDPTLQMFQIMLLNLQSLTSEFALTTLGVSHKSSCFTLSQGLLWLTFGCVFFPPFLPTLHLRPAFLIPSSGGFWGACLSLAFARVLGREAPGVCAGHQEARPPSHVTSALLGHSEARLALAPVASLQSPPDPAMAVW